MILNDTIDEASGIWQASSPMAVATPAPPEHVHDWCADALSGVFTDLHWSGG